MRVKDWIYKQILPKENEIKTLISQLEKEENLTKEKCIEFLTNVIENTNKVYLEAVNNTLHYVEQIDINFLNNNIPHHIK